MGRSCVPSCSRRPPRRVRINEILCLCGARLASLHSRRPGPSPAGSRDALQRNPRPREAPADRFQSWVNERLQGLGWYMEASNTGKCVKQHVSENAACAIVMRRIGALLGSGHCPIPKAADVYTLLENFIRDVRSYVRNIGDNSLRYVRSLRLYAIPRKKDGI